MGKSNEDVLTSKHNVRHPKSGPSRAEKSKNRRKKNERRRTRIFPLPNEKQKKKNKNKKINRDFYLRFPQKKNQKIKKIYDIPMVSQICGSRTKRHRLKIGDTRHDCDRFYLVSFWRATLPDCDPCYYGRYDRGFGIGTTRYLGRPL